MHFCTKKIVLGIIFSSMIMVAGASSGFAAEKFHISGYGNAHYMDPSGMPSLLEVDDATQTAENPNDGIMQMREFSLFFDFIVSDGVIASVEMEAGNNGTALTPNYAYVEIDVPEITDAWDADELGGLSLRIGRILVPFLSYNENKPNFRQNLMSQPFTAWNLAPVIPSPPNFVGLGWSDTGGMVNWNREVGDVAFVDLKLAVINGLQNDGPVLDSATMRLNAGGMTPIVRPRSGLVDKGHESVRDNNQNKATVSKLTFISASIPLDIGFSWYKGAWDKDGDHDVEMQGIHLNWLERDWTVKGEWVTASVEQTAGVNPVTEAASAGAAGVNTSTGNYDMNAWYVEASYIPMRYGGGDRFIRMVLRFDDVDTNDQAAFTPFDRSRITVGSEWQFVDHARFRYEWQRNTIDDFGNAPAAFVAAGGKERITVHMVSMIFWF